MIEFLQLSKIEISALIFVGIIIVIATIQHLFFARARNKKAIETMKQIEETWENNIKKLEKQSPNESHLRSLRQLIHKSAKKDWENSSTPKT